MAKQFKNAEWDLADTDGNVGTWEKVSVAVLMDIRREMQTLNRLLMCPNFTDMPFTLRAIAENTKKPKRRRKPKQ